MCVIIDTTKGEHPKQRKREKNMKIVDTNTNGTVAEILGGNRMTLDEAINNEHALVFVEKSSIANNPFEQMDWEVDSIMREIEGRN